MKKKILMLSVAFLMILTGAFAKENEPVPQMVIKELKQEFKTATNVQWKVTDNFYKASFSADGDLLEAFYSYQGNLIAVSRNISFKQLPLALIKDANDKGMSSQVKEIFELFTDHGTEYYLTLNAANNSKTFKSSGASWVKF